MVIFEITVLNGNLSYVPRLSSNLVQVLFHAVACALTVAALDGLRDALVMVLPDGRQKRRRSIDRSTATVFGILAARDSTDNGQRLAGGRLWQRMHLWGAANGLAMQPLNQPAERADCELQLGVQPCFGNALAELLGDPNWHALMPFRLGYPTQEARLSPRRSVEAVLA